MATDEPTGFPDITDLLARKAEGRASIRRLSFGEKIELMEALYDRLAPWREARRQATWHARSVAPPLHNRLDEMPNCNPNERLTD